MKMLDSASEEAEQIRIQAAYAARDGKGRYSYFNPGHVLMLQQRELQVLRLLKRYGYEELAAKEILEIGCGSGHWLRDFIKWGARPGNIVGVDIIPERVIEARNLCPETVRIYCATACRLDFPSSAFDLIVQSTVFTSVLDPRIRKQIACEMLRVLRPGGLIIWYDFHVNNPWNADVRGVTRREIHQLFPECRVELCRITLVPPLARLIGRQSLLLCSILERIPWLCTHYLGAIRKE